jgi:hypothetical protein
MNEHPGWPIIKEYNVLPRRCLSGAACAGSMAVIITTPERLQKKTVYDSMKFVFLLWLQAIFGQKFAECFAKSHARCSGSALSNWLKLDEFLLLES